MVKEVKDPAVSLWWCRFDARPRTEAQGSEVTATVIRVTAVAWIQLLAWGLPYAVGVTRGKKHKVETVFIH